MPTTEHLPKPLQVGVSSISITPPAGVAMQGYDVRYSEGITERLFVSALAVGGHRVIWILLSVDCIGVDRQFTARVRQTLDRRLGSEGVALMVASSHTHSGPATLHQLGAVTADGAYLAILEERLVAAAMEAAGNMQPARWRFGIESLPENVNRRVRLARRVELGVNPRGPVDSRLRVVRIDRASAAPDGPPLALIVHYACHATTSGGVSKISADWPGAMRTTLQRVYGETGDAPIVCFLQGCTGDVTHRMGRDREAWPDHFGESTSLQSTILGRLAAAAGLSASERSVEVAGEAVQAVVEPVELSFRDSPGSEETEIQVVRVGPAFASRRARGDAASVWFIGLPGEPFTAYSTELGRRWSRRFGVPSDRVLVCGYTNDCVGYLCTPKALREGGYEAAAAHRMYHRPSLFSSATQERVFAAASKAARTIVGDDRGDDSLLAAAYNALDRWTARRSRVYGGSR